MEINIKIDLEKEWVDGHLDEEFKSAIYSAVIEELRPEFSEKLERFIHKSCKESLENYLENESKRITTEILNNGNIQPYGYSKKVTIYEYAEKSAYQAVNKINSEIAGIAGKKIEELRNRYDEAFAKGIIENMDSMGLLKDGALTKLLSNNEKTRNNSNGND